MNTLEKQVGPSPQECISEEKKRQRKELEEREEGWI